jgi:two-component system NtrC family sensor kinase
MTAKKKPKDLRKQAAIGEAEGKAMHKLCGPLTGVLGYSQLLLKISAKNDPLRPDLMELEKAALRCKDIVDDFLKVSRRKPEGT